MAAGAQRAAARVVVQLTVRESLVIEEARRAERLVALLNTQHSDVISNVRRQSDAKRWLPVRTPQTKQSVPVRTRQMKQPACVRTRQTKQLVCGRTRQTKQSVCGRTRQTKQSVCVRTPQTKQAFELTKRGRIVDARRSYTSKENRLHHNRALLYDSVSNAKGTWTTVCKQFNNDKNSANVT